VKRFDVIYQQFTAHDVRQWLSDLL